MNNTSRYARALLLALISALAMSSITAQASSLRNAREFCKNHRFALLAITSAAALYLYSHKIVEKAIHDYYYPETINPKEQPKSTHDYCEACADIFIKSTKLVGTIFKVLRAVSCPDEGKIAGDQCFDDFAGLA